jgi:hypothetical protein
LIANFCVHCVRRIVEAFDGRVIYAGGDDVLAMLPADTALQCARALRAAFCGEKALPELAKGIMHRDPAKNSALWRSDRVTALFQTQCEGFLKLTPAAAPTGYGAAAGLLDEPVKFPFLVPGPAADCSAGIAIAHFKSPLQDVVREAQRAEKRAKKELGRSAVAVTLMKRSGETIEWGCQWESGGLALYGAVASAIEQKKLSRKFPYRVVELLSPYLPGKDVQGRDPFPCDKVITREFSFVIDRQRGKNFPKGTEDKDQFVASLEGALAKYLQRLVERSGKLNGVIGLCQTVGFASRISDEEENQ